jgi:hypothetical protein
MNNEQQEVLCNCTDGLNTEFVKFEENVRVKLGFTNFRTVQAEKSFDDEVKVVPEFRADVFYQDGKKVENKLNTISLPFRRNILKFIENKPRTDKMIPIQIIDLAFLSSQILRIRLWLKNQ